MMRGIIISIALIRSVVWVIVVGPPGCVWVLVEERHFECRLLRRELYCAVHFKSLEFQIYIYIHSYECH